MAFYINNEFSKSRGVFMMIKINLGFLVSHGGSNMQAIVDACNNGKLNANPCVVISNNSKSQALQRAKNENIPYYHRSSMTHPDFEELDKEISKIMKKYNVNIIILVGYMKKLGKKTLKHYKGKILNTHPSLLPKFGGKGMYGNYVHEAVLKSGDNVTGITIHIVDEGYDTGAVINQCKVPVLLDDTVETLKDRVLKREHTFFVETLNLISEGKIIL